MAIILHAESEASSWVKRFVPTIPRDGVVLDLACGTGRHAWYLANLGYHVLAVDQNVAIQDDIKNAFIETRVLDLEGEIWPFQAEKFAAIVVTNYLYRPYMGYLPNMLVEGGVLIYETFAAGNEAFGRPSNPNFLLNSGELLAFATEHDLKVLAYEDIYVDQPKPAMIQRICAVKGELKERIPLQFVS